MIGKEQWKVSVALNELESNFQNGISQQRMIVIEMQSYIFVFVTFIVNTHPVLWKQEL